MRTDLSLLSDLNLSELSDSSVNWSTLVPNSKNNCVANSGSMTLNKDDRVQAIAPGTSEDTCETLVVSSSVKMTADDSSNLLDTLDNGNVFCLFSLVLSWRIFRG